jgi:electron transfer flavoprotein beta subunit
MLAEQTPNHFRKALAIGANEAIRINANSNRWIFCSKTIAEVVKNGGYDLVICGKESLDYNGGMVPGMLQDYWVIIL